MSTKRNLGYNIEMKKNVLLVMSALILAQILISCTLKDPCVQITQKEIFLHQEAQKAYQYALEMKAKRIQAFDDYINSLSTEQKISQMFVVNLEGNANFKPVEKDYIPGGYLFFAYNLSETPEKIISFTDSIRNYYIENNQIVPFLSIDQEGGLVNRLKGISGPLPSAQRVKEILSADDAYDLYSYQAIQMKNLGLNMNLAPVVEILNDENKDFLSQRSFGDLQDVKTYGEKCIQAYESNGVSTVIKHFPGNSNVDPHTGLPVLGYDEKQLAENLEPFEYLLQLNPDAVLMSHVIVTSVDPLIPACLSKIWVTDILRNRMKYEGVIFSDDIFMAALAKNGYPPEKAVIMAVEAGIDCIMISEKRISKCVDILKVKAAEDTDFSKMIDESVRRIIQYKIDNGILECKFEKDGQYHINNRVINLSVDERTKEFNKTKSLNDNFYIQHFLGK